MCLLDGSYWARATRRKRAPSTAPREEEGDENAVAQKTPVKRAKGKLSTRRVEESPTSLEELQADGMDGRYWKGAETSRREARKKKRALFEADVDAMEVDDANEEQDEEGDDDELEGQGGQVEEEWESEARQAFEQAEMAKECQRYGRYRQAQRQGCRAAP